MIATVNGNNTRAVCSTGIPSGDGGAKLEKAEVPPSLSSPVILMIRVIYVEVSDAGGQ